LDYALENNNFTGIVYLTHNGKVVYQSVSGSNDLGEPLTIDSPMYIASISKQFCAAAVLMLRDQGKLRLDDTLEKYFPEYTIGKDITLKHLLSMRSGIVRDIDPMYEKPELYKENTPEENEAAVKEWLFSQPLVFEPDTEYMYSNSNYTLLSFVVEMVSGQSYEDFIRQNIFDPLDMTHSNFCADALMHPEWGLICYDYVQTDAASILVQGVGDIITTAADLDKWMTALPRGQVICEESYREMTTCYSTDPTAPYGYGYGLAKGIRDGWGHGGYWIDYTSQTFYSMEYGYNFYIVTGNTPQFLSDLTMRTTREFLNILFQAVDEAEAN
jgi:CubicO group peptidase (beta-lactamase class C family)